MVMEDFQALQTEEKYLLQVQVFLFFHKLVSLCVRRFLSNRVIVSHRDQFFHVKLLFRDISRDNLLSFGFR